MTPKKNILMTILRKNVCGSPSIKASDKVTYRYMGINRDYVRVNVKIVWLLLIVLALDCARCEVLVR